MKKLGIGDWGLGIGDWGLGQIPNPQSPIPNSINIKFKYYLNFNFELNIFFIIIATKLKKYFNKKIK